MTSDKDFEKFREKKLNEKAASKHEDDAVFFGGNTLKKKEDEDGPKKIKLSDLDIPGQDDRPDNIPKVGEGLKLIDIALGDAPGGPPQPKGKPAPRPQGARPGTGAPARPGNQTMRPGQQPTAVPRPGQPSRPLVARPTPPPVARPTPKPGQGQATPRPGQPPTRRPVSAQPLPGPKKPEGVQLKPTARLRPEDVTPQARPLPPPAGFQDRASAKDSNPRGEVVRQDDNKFEDSNFAEANDRDDPYEFKDDEPPASSTSATRRARPGSPAQPYGQPDLRSVKPQQPPPPPKKTSTRRQKRPGR